jgi:4-hydroxybenzoate polyprenyltransferase/phosphoserine phosphatase
MISDLAARERVTFERPGSNGEETRRSSKPVCVDLDGTLVNSDLLVEGFLSIAGSWQILPCLARLLRSGRAAFKEAVATRTTLSPELLPYNLDVIEKLEALRHAGRRIVLVTAADRHVAHSIADHLGIFDEVIASDGATNLKGEAKARLLEERFGTHGFDYIGNARCDLPIWEVADRIGLVNASKDVADKARRLRQVDFEFTLRTGMFAAALRAMRPHQWSKNLLVFIPLLASMSFHDYRGGMAAIIIFASLCATASAIYLINDLLDLPSDRRHPRKRNRPLASGALPLTTGAALSAALMTVGFGLASLADGISLVALYASVALGYSLFLKKYPLVDVFILAALYTLRVVIGGVVSGYPVTVWLLAFSGFTFIGLAMVKRAAELARVGAKASEPAVARRGYRKEDRPILFAAGIAAAFASSVVLALYVSSDTAFQQYRSPETLLGLVPLVLFWELRLWLSTERGNMHDDPIVFATRDWVSWIVGASFLGLMIAAASFDAWPSVQ